MVPCGERYEDMKRVLTAVLALGVGLAAAFSMALSSGQTGSSRPSRGPASGIRSLPAAETASANLVRNIGTTSHGSGAISSLAITATGGVAAGDSIIVAFVASAVAGTVGCADTAGNTYGVDADRTNTSGGRIVICSAHDVLPLAGNDTITVTFPSSSSGAAASANEFSGLAAALSTGKQPPPGTPRRQIPGRPSRRPRPTSCCSERSGSAGPMRRHSPPPAPAMP